MLTKELKEKARDGEIPDGMDFGEDGMSVQLGSSGAEEELGHSFWPEMLTMFGGVHAALDEMRANGFHQQAALGIGPLQADGMCEFRPAAEPVEDGAIRFEGTLYKAVWDGRSMGVDRERVLATAVVTCTPPKEEAAEFAQEFLKAPRE